MRPIRCSFALLAALPLIAQASLTSAADKLDNDDKKWLAQVEAIIQPDEVKVFKSIPKGDRQEFETLFWARRNPNGPMAATNPYKDKYLQDVAEADKKFAVPGRSGSNTDCGRAFLALGVPDQTGLARLGNMSLEAADGYMQTGRKAETWTYKPRPEMRFQGATLFFDEGCQLPLESRSTIGAQLNKMAAVHIVSPGIKAEIGQNGRLVTMAELAKRSQTPLQALLSAPRQDFAFEQQPKLAMRVKEGTYLAGLLRIPVDGLTVKEEGGAKKIALQTATQLIAADGQVGRGRDGERVATVTPDGRAIISYAAVGAPGAYTLRVAVLDPASGKGAVVEAPVSLPDLGSEGLRLSDPQVFAGMDPVIQPDPKDALVDFLMGSVRLVPRFDNAFKKSDQIQFVCFGYNAAVNPASGKPALTVRFEVYKGDKPATGGSTMAVDTADFAPVLGPIPLTAVEPGKYRLQVTANDIVAKTNLKASVTYDVVP